MEIDLNNLLWRTRGHKWEYDFVLRPAYPRTQTWYEFHTDVFAYRTPGRDPETFGGVLHTINGEVIHFVATAFLDPSLRDEAGRPPAHYLVWFLANADVPVRFELPADWGLQVLKAFGDEWEKAFRSDFDETHKVIDQVRDEALSVLESARLEIGQVSLSDPSSDQNKVRVEFTLEVTEKKKRQPIPTLNKRPFLRRTTMLPLVILVVLLVLLLVAVVIQRRDPQAPVQSTPVTTEAR